MLKKISAIVSLSLFIYFTVSCSIPYAFKEEGIKTSPEPEIKAKKLPEVQLKTNKGEIYTGKISALEEKNLVLLPFPYWDVEPIKIDLDEIYSIKLTKKVSKAGRRAAGGFAWGFIITGALSGLSSKYDEDYKMALIGSAAVGGTVGLIGFVIGGLSEAATKSKYDFYKMSYPEKIDAINKIMGY
jgi:hypothetical protein